MSTWIGEIFGAARSNCKQGLAIAPSQAGDRVPTPSAESARHLPDQLKAYAESMDTTPNIPLAQLGIR